MAMITMLMPVLFRLQLALPVIQEEYERKQKNL